MQTDKNFSGAIASVYDTHMVPMIFEPYAVEMARRAAALAPQRVLELAAGTGVVTRHLAATLAPSVSITATDLNPAMLGEARRVGTARPVQWKAVDAMSLPFDEGAFDLVVCQFGVMFFPDKAKAFAEARRVLRPGGTFLFDVWDRIAENEFADVVTRALAALFPNDAPVFMARTPHGYFDAATIVRDLAAGGFTAKPEVTTMAARSRTASARNAAIAYIQGTPLRNEIESRDATRLAEATDVSARALAQYFGSGAVDGKMQALIVAVAR
ncbi:MAG TPA: class I SAM-dependent methyltransferase [Usitatibacter sp.]|nr:class I SAM-dependent methyltransferase [Usitatibacter sp.]